MLILNLKNYPSVSNPIGQKYFDAGNKVIEENPELKDVVYFSPPVLDILSYKSNNPDLSYISQHVDNKGYGSTTGRVPYTRLIDENISYSLLNHSEFRFADKEELYKSITDIQNTGIKLVVCAENVEEIKQILEYKPYAVAYEPPELIGTGDSVTNRPDAVKEFIQTVGDKSLPFIGAGVSNGEDIQNSLDLGAKGILLASRFVKADDPYQKLVELTRPFLK